MRQLKEFQTGGAGDSVNSGGDFSVATNKFTVASATGNTAVAGTLAVTGVATLTAQPILSSLTASKAVFTDASKGLVSNDVTGTGNVVMSNSPTLVTPALGTPSSGVVTNLTGTASININGTVGATTPSTGAFTTLSSTGNTTLGDASGDTITINGTTTFVNANPTLSAGTANGVLYLNGSKVATSGSALTFDGTTFKVQNNNAATAVFQIQSYAAAGTGIANITYDQGTDIYKFSNWSTYAGAGIDFGTGVSSTTRYHIDTSGVHVWTVASEGMRLTSTGLGIGTSSPSTKLTVAGDSLLSVASGNIGYGWLSGTTNYSLYLNAADNSLRFYSSVGTAGDKLIMSSAGNLGLGVTPSAWNSTYRGFELGKVGNGVYGWSGGGLTGLVAGAYIDSAYNWKYALSSQAIGKYEITETGKHVWSLAASGTAGNTVSFTSAMTLDASGRLFLGTSTANAKLNVVQALGTSGTASGIWVSDDATTSTFVNNVSNGVSGVWSSGALAFGTGSNTFTERARIDSSGNLLVGTTSSLSGSSHSFKAIGTTAANYAGVFRQDATGSNGRVFAWQLPNTSDSASYFVYATNSGGNCLNIFGNGNITNSNNSYGAISDAKLKENVTDATPKLEKLNQVRVVNYNLIGGEQKQIGVIAQELEQIFPSMVEETADKDVDGNDLGTTTKSVKYSVFVPMLIKAMQEQQAIIQQLTARVAQLESN